MICTAEKDALEAKRLAEENAREAIEDAHIKGKSSVAATLARADSESVHLIRASHLKATTEAAELAATTANRIATLRARAERRLDNAALLIIERLT